jgi:hypothetical protein
LEPPRVPVSYTHSSHRSNELYELMARTQCELSDFVFDCEDARKAVPAVWDSPQSWAGLGFGSDSDPDPAPDAPSCTACITAPMVGLLRTAWRGLKSALMVF